MTRRAAAAVAFGATLAALAPRCAQRGAPPGGPIDSEPPAIVAIEPASGATRVPIDAPIRLAFSERVDRKSVERAIRVFPEPDAIAFSWIGEELTITLGAGAPVGEFGERVVVLFSTATDRRRNRLESAVSSAFTTRDTIPDGAVAGKLSGARAGAPARVLLFDGDAPPSESLAVARFLREGAPDADGSFRFEFLPVEADRRYAVAALSKESSGPSLDVERDRVAFGPDTVLVVASGEALAPLSLALVAPDATGSVRGRLAAPSSRQTVVARSLGDSTRVFDASPDSSGVFLLDSIPEGRYRIVVRDDSTGAEVPAAEIPSPLRIRPGQHLSFVRSDTLDANGANPVDRDSTLSPVDSL